jgi:thioredoxin 2
MNTIISLENSNFKATLIAQENNDHIVVVLFWVSWCGHCKTFKPVFEEVAKELNAKNSEKIKFCEIETTKGPKIASKAGIQGTPTTCFFKNGKEVDRITGSCSKEELVDVIKNLS